MAFRGEREYLVGKIAELQSRQLNMHQEATFHNWTPEQSALAFDKRFAHIVWLMRELTKLDEVKNES
jgi:hypothetical protein